MSKINRNFRHIIPREIDSEMKFVKFLSANDLIIAGAIIVFCFNLEFLVNEKLLIFYIIFILAFCVFMLIPATKFNANKKTYHVLYYAFIKERKTYFSINQPQGDDDFENKNTNIK